MISSQDCPKKEIQLGISGDLYCCKPEPDSWFLGAETQQGEQRQGRQKEELRKGGRKKEREEEEDRERRGGRRGKNRSAERELARGEG